MDFSQIKKIYMIGVKGVGMTMLAQYFKAQGIEISGSDIEDEFMTDEVLKKQGIKVIEEFKPANLPTDADLIIYSTAYRPEQNQELAAALAGKTKILTFAQALAEVFNQKYGLAVVGSHGKTTTTAWLGYVLDKAGVRPNVLVGAKVPQFEGFALTSSSDYLVVEVDEYQNKLQYFQPKVVLLNNIDYDHPDFFTSPAEYQQVFIEFIKKIPAKGLLIANFDDPIIRKIARVNCLGKIITYAIEEAADLVAYDLKQQAGQQFFKVKISLTEEEINEDEFEFKNSDLGNFSIQLAGKHNVLNALAVIAVSIELGVELYQIRKYLAEFTGTDRRMQVLGNFKGAEIIDDYAHHPTEIKATLEAVRQKYTAKKIYVVFHPHTFSRTKTFFNEFAQSFSLADELLVLYIYSSARENRGPISSRDLVKKIKEYEPNKKVHYMPSQKLAEDYLRQTISRGEVVVLMGAGDVFRIGQNLVKI